MDFYRLKRFKFWFQTINITLQFVVENWIQNDFHLEFFCSSLIHVIRGMKVFFSLFVSKLSHNVAFHLKV